MKSLFEERVIRIDDRLRSAVVLQGTDGDGGAMFIGAANKGYILIEHSQHADEDVGRQVGSSKMSDVERAIGIG